MMSGAVRALRKRSHSYDEAVMVRGIRKMSILVSRCTHEFTHHHQILLSHQASNQQRINA